MILIPRCEAPVRLRTRSQLTGDERPASENPKGSVGDTRREREGADCDNQDEDQDAERHEQLT